MNTPEQPIAPRSHPPGAPVQGNPNVDADPDAAAVDADRNPMNQRFAAVRAALNAVEMPAKTPVPTGQGQAVQGRVRANNAEIPLEAHVVPSTRTLHVAAGDNFFATVPLDNLPEATGRLGAESLQFRAIGDDDIRLDSVEGDAAFWLQINLPQVKAALCH